MLTLPRRAAWAAALSAALSAGCTSPPAPDPPAAQAECAALRERAEKARKAWIGANEAAPPDDATIAALADHAEKLARAARDVAADFAAQKPSRRDLADASEGVRMLGGLAGEKLAALGGTLRELGGRLGPLEKLENAANDAAQGIGPEAAAGVGCGDKAGACGAVVDRLTELLRTGGVVMGLEDAAKASIARADALDAIAQAVDALPPAPAKRQAREDLAKRARAAAEAFRALSRTFAEAAPIQARVKKDQQTAQEAALRLTAEIDAAAAICAPPAASSASARPPSASARPAAPPASGTAR